MAVASIHHHSYAQSSGEAYDQRYDVYRAAQPPAAPSRYQPIPRVAAPSVPPGYTPPPAQPAYAPAPSIQQTTRPVNPPPARPRDPGRFTSHARIIIVDKRTAEREDILLAKGNIAAYEDIEIKLHRCWIEPTKIYPEHATLVDIYQPDNAPQERRVFAGWLFANASDASYMQHRYYDVMLHSCVMESSDETSG